MSTISLSRFAAPRLFTALGCTAHARMFVAMYIAVASAPPASSQQHGVAAVSFSRLSSLGRTSQELGAEPTPAETIPIVNSRLPALAPEASAALALGKHRASQSSTNEPNTRDAVAARACVRKVELGERPC